MSNPHRGDVAFEAGGKAYTLRYSANAICELETAFDKGFIAIATDMAAWEKNPRLMRLGAIRTLFWAGLQDHHPDIDQKVAGELVLELGGIEKAADLIMEALKLAFPEAAAKVGARPPKRGGAGTGSRS